MRVAFLVRSFPSISETFVLNQITGLIKRGHDVQIFSLERPAKGVEHPDVSAFGLRKKTTYLPDVGRTRWARWLWAAVLLPRYCLSNPRLLRLLVNRHARERFGDIQMCAMASHYVKQDAYDITYAQFGIQGLRTTWLRQTAIIGPLVTSFRGYDATVVLSKKPDIYRDLFAVGDLFLAVSEFLRQKVLSHGCPEAKLLVHHDGVDLRELSFRGEEYPADGTYRLLCIARLVEVKGVGVLLDAFADLVRRGYDVVLDILGDGPLREAYGVQSERVGVSHLVAFHGFCPKPQVAEFLRKAHVLVAPSIVAGDAAEEGMPNSVKEAMAVGVPVVATRTGGIPELIEDGVSGILVAQNDVQALADGITFLLDNPPAWPAMTRSARKKIEREFDAEKLNDRLVRIFEDLVSDQAGKSEEPTNPRKE